LYLANYYSSSFSGGIQSFVGVLFSCFGGVSHLIKYGDERKKGSLS